MVRRLDCASWAIVAASRLPVASSFKLGDVASGVMGMSARAMLNPIPGIYSMSASTSSPIDVSVRLDGSKRWDRNSDNVLRGYSHSTGADATVNFVGRFAGTIAASFGDGSTPDSVVALLNVAGTWRCAGNAVVNAAVPSVTLHKPYAAPLPAPITPQLPPADPYAAATAAGATAVCADKSWSYSQHRSGTCSGTAECIGRPGNLGAAGPGDHRA